MKKIGYLIICALSLFCCACTESNYNYIVQKNRHGFPVEEK